MANQEPAYGVYQLAEQAIVAVEDAYHKMLDIHHALHLPNPRIEADSPLHLLGNDPSYEIRMREAYSVIVQAVDEMARASVGRPTKEEETALHDAKLAARRATPGMRDVTNG